MRQEPIKVTANKNNFKLSKNSISCYPDVANTDRSTNLFINGYRIVGGCVALNKTKTKILMIQSTYGGLFIIPKGGVESDELRYRKVNEKEIREAKENKQFLKSFLDTSRLKIKNVDVGKEEMKEVKEVKEEEKEVKEAEKEVKEEEKEISEKDKETSEKEVFFNYENIPGVAYDFSEGALREAWEESGVKGTVDRPLGTYYDYRDPSDYAEFAPWAIRTPHRFPKALDFYYQVTVDEVCDIWPEKAKRVQKWQTLDDCVDNLVANGRLAALKAVLKSDLVPDLQKFYLDRFNADVKNLLNRIVKPGFQNRFYHMRSPTTNQAREVVVTIVLNKSKEKILIDTRDVSFLPSDYVSIDHYPFAWRASRFYAKIPGIFSGRKPLLSLSSWLGELPCDYMYKKEFDETLSCFEEGCYRLNLTALEFSCIDDETLLSKVNPYEHSFYKWVTLAEWKEMNKVKGEFYKKLEYFLVNNSAVLGSKKNPVKKEAEELAEELAEEMAKLNL